MPRPRKDPDELIQRGVRLALELGRPIAHIAKDLGMHPETLRKRVRQVEADSGLRPDLPSSEEREEIKRLRSEAVIPPPASEPPDVAALAQVAAEYGIEILGPPGTPPEPSRPSAAPAVRRAAPRPTRQSWSTTVPS
jgi:transposase